MTEGGLFHHTEPLRYGESQKMREIFDRMVSRIKQHSAEQGRPITDQEAIEATRNWIRFAELAAEVAGRQMREAVELE